jgi:L-ascorbate metabolism protein UlaG (beta-lactamase superfamily)
MEINWYGHSCFRLTERGKASVVTDPYDPNVVGYHPLSLKADIVTVSHDSPGHNYTKAVKGYRHLINGPGEYEIGGVFITAVQTNTNKKDSETPPNLVYVFDYEGIAIAHLGDLRRIPKQTEVEALGNITVALVPVGGGGSLPPSKAVEVVSLLEPEIVIPMHYGTSDSKIELSPVEDFLKEMGIGVVEPQSSLKITRRAKSNETSVVVLDYKK